MAEDSTRPNFTGRYKHVKVEGFDDYLRADGVGFMARKMMQWMKPDVDIKQDGDKFDMKMTFPMFKKQSSFTVGEEFVEEQQGCETMKVNPFWKGDNLVMQLTPQKEGKGKPRTYTRSLNGDEMIMTMEIGEAKATRWFNRLPEVPESKTPEK